MANYYFLAPMLPPLIFGQKPALSFHALISLIDANIKGEDLEKTVVLRRWIDLNNIRALYLEEPVDARGNLSEKELDQALLLQDGFPEYVFDFLNQFESVEEKIRFFPGLLTAYFREEGLKQKGFLKIYLEFERDWRLVLMAIKAKELGRDITEELQFEDLKDSLVLDVLVQKDAASYAPPVEFVSFGQKYLSCGKDPWQQFKEMGQWRFEQIEDLVKKPLFSIDWILSYMARLLILEETSELDSTKGEIILEAFVG